MAGGWDGQTQQLRPEYCKYLSEGAISPRLCFPWDGAHVGEDYIHNGTYDEYTKKLVSFLQ